MKHFLSTCGILLVAACWIAPAVKASQGGDARSTCERFANTRYRANDPKHFEKISLAKQEMIVEKLNSKMGSQHISSVLSGNGTFKLKQTEPMPIQFTCLLENDQKTVFFHAGPIKQTKIAQPIHQDPIKDCTEHVPTIGEAVPCLLGVLNQEENKLVALTQQMNAEASSIDHQWKTTKAQQLMGQSENQWKQYRDTECKRRLEFRAGGNHPDITEVECKITKTQERISDLSFNN